MAVLLDRAKGFEPSTSTLARLPNTLFVYYRPNIKKIFVINKYI